MNTTNGNNALMEAVGVSKQYKGGLWANRDISLAVQPGEIVGILGPNGAGKTTLVRQITTELLPTSGSIRVLGVDAVAHPQRAKSLMGIVPQEAKLYESLSVEQVFRVFGKLRGLSPKDARRRAEEMLHDLRLQEYRGRLTIQLSGGLQRRVMVGIAMLARPPLMVLDEPTTGLDPQSRRDLWALLRRQRDQGTAVLLTTHYMEEAEALCDRVGIIQRGRLLALDTVPRLRSELGFEFKITYAMNGEGSGMQTEYGTDDAELIERVREHGIHQFSVVRTTLEDVYLALTDGKEGLSGDAS
jgi:ABC-2 type transport system ATP-binding protein